MLTFLFFFITTYQLGTRPDVWEWMSDVLVPGLYPTVDYNGNHLSTYDKKFIISGYGIKLGVPKIRQIRIKPGK